MGWVSGHGRALGRDFIPANEPSGDRDVPADESSYPLTPKFPSGGWRTESVGKLYRSRRRSLPE
jgi:hypothetical protein